jgi:hypothetical protein
LVLLDLKFLQDAAARFVETSGADHCTGFFSMEACRDDDKWISDGMEVQLKSSCVSMITTLLHKGHQAENFGKGTELKPPDFYGN